MSTTQHQTVLLALFRDEHLPGQPPSPPARLPLAHASLMEAMPSPGSQPQPQPQHQLHLDFNHPTNLSELTTSYGPLTESDPPLTQPDPSKMAPPSAEMVGGVLGSESPNQHIGMEQHTANSWKRWEIHPSSVLPGAFSETARTPTGAAGLKSSENAVPSHGLRIPGFDPSRYGKPNLSPWTDSAANQRQSPSPSVSTGIHSAAPTYSTVNESGPATPYLHSDRPTVGSIALLPAVHVLPISGDSPATAADHIRLSDAQNEKHLTTHSIVRINANNTGDSVNTQTQVAAKALTKPSQAAPTTPHQPQTKGRSKAMNDPVIPQLYGRPLPSSNRPIGEESPQQKLQRLKLNELNSINSRNRRKERDQTSSLATLSALRLPLAPEKEQKVAARTRYYHNLGATSVPAQDDAVIPALTEDDATLPANHLQRVDSSNPQPSLTEHDTDQPVLATPIRGSQNQPRQAHDSSARNSIDYYVPPHARPTSHKRSPRWVTNEEIKPEEVSNDSNAWGSVDPDQVSADSGDSVIAIHQGDVPNKRPQAIAEASLIGWDGKLQPPPIDWADRPRFNNNNPDYKEAFNMWTQAVSDKMISGQIRAQSADHPFQCVDADKVKDTRYHADGLDMVPVTTTIRISNARNYGYSADIDDAILNSQPLTHEELGRVVTIEVNDPSNAPILQETTETVVQRYLAHHNIQFDSLVRNEEMEGGAPKMKEDHKPKSNPYSPKVGIYLRPAVATDIPQMTAIYNWHVENGPRTAELRTVPESDMRERMEEVTSSKLPLIVAVMKVKKRFRRSRSASGHANRSNGQGNGITQRTKSEYSGMTREERIAGWGCAQDWTFKEYVERISAELEIYVSPELQQRGVGTCLMDKLMDACDRGHLKQGGYDFDCAPEKSYLYNGGGGRDLHKLYFTVRTWSKPRKVTRTPQKDGSAVGRGAGQMQDQIEDDYGEWLKPWLEKWDFKVEGALKEAGAKNGRYLDIIHLGRQTYWQPADGEIPEPLPGAG